MGYYYVLVKNNEVYATTSEDYKKIAVLFGFKYCGYFCGKNLSHGLKLLKITKEMKVAYKL